MNTWYKVWYGSWEKNDKVVSVIKTYSRNEAFDAAQETANMVNREVYLMEQRATGRGVYNKFHTIMPSTKGE